MIRISLAVALLSLSSASPTRADGVSDHEIYASAGVSTGRDHLAFGAVTAAAGYRITDQIWIHTGLSGGSARRDFFEVNVPAIDSPVVASSYFEARGGIELRRCTERGVACAVGGIDAGFRHEYLRYDDGMPGTGFDNAVLVPRLGGELGNTHLRLRLMFEPSTDSAGKFGWAIALGGAYEW